METLKENLQEDFNIDKISYSTEDKTFDFHELATKIMNHYCISNGQYHYYPIEIEFYVYINGKHEDHHVYPRDNKNNGDLFFHYSGIDICFESSLQNGSFGGALIRALERIEKDKNGNILYYGGPLVCVNEILNTAKRECSLEEIHRPGKEVNAEKYGQRVGIKAIKKTEDNYFDREYRFVREDVLDNKKIIFASKNSYNFKKHSHEKKPSSYKIEKYKP